MIIKIFYIYHKINLIFLFYKLIKKYIKKFCLNMATATVENTKTTQKNTLFQCPKCNLVPEMIFKFKNGELFVICKCENNHINSVPLKDFMSPLKDKKVSLNHLVVFFFQKFFLKKKRKIQQIKNYL